MNRTIIKIAVILIILILLPAAVFTLYEFGALSENERVIEEIYSNQLESILNSVNQYSEDVTGSWRMRIEMMLPDTDFNRKIDSTFRQIKPVKGVFFGGDSAEAYAAYNPEEINAANIINENQKLLERLRTYKRGGYYKIEPVQTANGNILLLFMLNDPSTKRAAGAIIIDPEVFARELLGPKISTVAREQFIIAVYGESGSILYSTESTSLQNLKVSKQLWLMPGYSLGISHKGTTIEELVEGRMITNIILISVLTAVLIGGVWFVFRYIKKEVELAQIKSDFVSNVSHELRTPLALISMFAETLEMGRVKSEERKNEYYKIISQEAGRLSRIVNKILNFSRMESGKQKYHFELINLNDVVSQVYSTYKFHLQNNGFKFNLELDNELPDTAADKEALSEAVINLIDNAAKYSGERKEIIVRTGMTGSNLFIEVLDYGLGISEEDKKRIFEKFYRVSHGLVHNTKGTGLGLSIVQHIVTAHNGEVELKSQPGEGSCFRLNIPLNNKEGVKNA